MYASIWIWINSIKYLLPMIEGHGDDAYRYIDGIKSDFSSNICPAPLSASDGGRSALMAHLMARGQQLLGHYPEPEAWSLERLLAEHHGIDPACVIVTSGATDAIYLVAQTFRYQPVIPVPTFSEYEDACSLFPSNSLTSTCCWLCNPNNPTGAVYSMDYINRQCAQHTLVVIDQSYEHYTSQPVLSPKEMLLPNVIQLHSMTKTYAVPGLRLGYIIAPIRLTDAIRRYMRPWSVSSLAVEAGKFLLEHDDMLRVHPDLAEAQRLWHALNAIPALEVLPTQTNFMLCRIKGDVTAAALKDHLARRYGMLIRDASNFRSLTPQHFRVAAQLPSENDALVRAIKDFLHA